MDRTQEQEAIPTRLLQVASPVPNHFPHYQHFLHLILQHQLQVLAILLPPTTLVFGSVTSPSGQSVLNRVQFQVSQAFRRKAPLYQRARALPLFLALPEDMQGLQLSLVICRHEGGLTSSSVYSRPQARRAQVPGRTHLQSSPQHQTLVLKHQLAPTPRYCRLLCDRRP